MSKDLFFEMQAEQFVSLYDPTFTKKDAIKQGVKIVQNILNNGQVGKCEFMANLARLKAVIDSAESEMRKHLPFEKINVLGVEFTPVNGGDTLNYADDEVWQTLKNDLDARTELLKLAQKQEVADLYGNLIPKVSKTPRKSSITLKF